MTEKELRMCVDVHHVNMCYERGWMPEQVYMDCLGYIARFYNLPDKQVIAYAKERKYKWEK